MVTLAEVIEQPEIKTRMEATAVSMKETAEELYNGTVLPMVKKLCGYSGEVRLVANVSFVPKGHELAVEVVITPVFEQNHPDMFEEAQREIFKMFLQAALEKR